MARTLLSIRTLIQAANADESLAVQAAVEGSRLVAMQAFVAKLLLDEMLDPGRPWVPWGAWFPASIPPSASSGQAPKGGKGQAWG